MAHLTDLEYETYRAYVWIGDDSPVFLVVNYVLNKEREGRKERRKEGREGGREG